MEGMEKMTGFMDDLLELGGGGGAVKGPWDERIGCGILQGDPTDGFKGPVEPTWAQGFK